MREKERLFTNSKLVDRMKILITGAAGFIGSNLSSHLLQTTSHSIVSVDNLSGTPDLDNMQFALGHRNNRHKFYLLNIADSEITSKLLEIEKPDVIINAAGGSDSDPVINKSLYNHACAASVRKFISLIDNISETTNECKFTHITADCVFGPRQGANCSIPKIIDHALNNIGMSNLSTDIGEFIYIKDFLDAICLVIDSKNINIDSVHVGGTLTTLESVGIYLHLLVKESPEVLPVRISKTTSLDLIALGWEIRRPIDQALEHTLQWYNLNKWAFKS